MYRVGFTKMQGAGNDYIYVNTSVFPIRNPEKLAIKWSKYHTGIGSDGLVLIGNSDKADFSMRIFNADGSEAKMCGNASRCVGKYLYDNHLTDKTELLLDTLSGIKLLKLQVVDGKVTHVTVDMGIPESIYIMSEGYAGCMIDMPIMVGKKSFKATAISMGNPHLVIFVDDVDRIELEKVGPMLENNPLFPDRINVEFAQVKNKNSIRMRVWERGSGITQACGTGACATAVAGFMTGRTERISSVNMDGGVLTICWDEETDHVLMTGDAVKVFDGEVEID
ncbi:diaminopimelate epimerase [Coprobacter fastidiosus]|mgnify:FL=1|jgi:diaminopimelate epimerase|uniref:diaminopimelate epimerase n=1 Tax=Coprobacter fastidiosus TaxID=1099853 RepID=UPI0026707A01|nr:diaminopimelate epimerase [Coprobacter fastidiosus]